MTGESPGAHERRARIAFLAVTALFLVLGLLMAVGNNSPGHWDAVANLVTARNVAEGRGFVSHVVQHLAKPEALPGPDTVRAPGIPFVAGALFLLLGVTYVVPILLNVVAVVLTALCLRHALREVGAGWTADLLALLVLVSHRTYEMRSLWNNNVLALLAALLLLLTVRHIGGRIVGWKFAAALGLVAALGFFMKQTFLLGAIPLGVGLLVTDARQPLARRLAQAAAFVALFILLTAPYWGPNLVRFGEPLYSPIQGLRLPTRYGLLGTLEYFRTVHFDDPPYSYASIAAVIGARGLMERELAQWAHLFRELVMLNPFLLLAAALGLALARLQHWRLYAAVVAIAIPPIFESSYWIAERRYLFPIHVLLLFLTGLAVREWRTWAEAGASADLSRRVRRVATGLFAGALLFALLPSARQWRWELIASRHADPGWVTAVRALPRSAVVLATVPPLVSWYTRHPAVIAPIGSREDALAVVRAYRTTHYLEMDPGHPFEPPGFAPADLTLIASGDDWRLFRIEEAAGVRAPGS